ncbi:MAG TPA: SDR family oxidoreductase [Planctomycetota bacterium]|nr:SDR family oxidoreductase [Planctomycetota bacterium]
MNQSASKVILITGASSGIGKACAEHLASRGHRVFGTTRKNPGKNGAVEFLSMDVTDENSVREGVLRVAAEAGRLDVVVNNAGFGIAGAVEETSVEEAKLQFDTNVFGVLRVCRAALPVLRRQGSGLIVNVSSIGGLMGLPFEGLYSASKFALEGLSEALRLEVRQFGIRVVLVEPGDFRTSFAANRIWTKESEETSAYRAARRAVQGVLEHDEKNAPDAHLVARLVGRIVEKRSPALRYPVGLFLQKLAVGLKRILPAWGFERILRSAYKL